MKRLLILFVLVGIGFSGRSQVESDTPETATEAIEALGYDHDLVADSAVVVLERYLNLLNFDSIRTDSILYIESHIFSRSHPEDTIVMKRWFYPEANYRTELWSKDTLEIGLRSNGYDTFFKYDKKKRAWFKTDVYNYYENFGSYNFHGPFFHWQQRNVRMRYDGIWNFQGHEAYRLFVKQGSYFDRYYMFEKESGLLFMYDELDSYLDMEHDETRHVEWRAFHEYQPLDKCLFPSVESYMIDNDIVMIYHHYRYVAFDYDYFMEDLVR